MSNNKKSKEKGKHISKKNKDKGKGRAKEVDSTNEPPKLMLRLKLPTIVNKNGESSGQASNATEKSLTSNVQPKIFLRLPAFKPVDVFQMVEQANLKRPLRITEESSSEEEEQPEVQSGVTNFRVNESPRKKRKSRNSYQRQYQLSVQQREYQRGYQQSEQQREYQLEYQQRYRRQAHSTPTPSLSPWEITRQSYEKAIKEGPTVVCICCAGLFFVKGVSLFNKQDISEKWGCEKEIVDAAFWTVDNNVFNSHRNIVISKGNDNKYYFCATCKGSLKSKKVPTIALMKGLNFPSKVACIERLTRLEERLVAPRHFFQSIYTHKGESGQYKSKGGIVNVPVTVDTTVNSLPRNLDESNTIHVSLARKLTFKTDYMKGIIDPNLVWEAARYLKDRPLFVKYDVTLTDNDLWKENNGYNNDGNVDDINGNDVESENNASSTTDDEPLNVLGTDSLITSDNNTSIRLAPGEGSTPLSLIKDKDSDFLSFLKIFCGERLAAVDSISYAALSKSISRRFDRRAVERADYLLYMDRKRQLLKMCSNINTILRKRNNMQNDNQPFTVKDVGDEDHVARLLNKDQAFKTFSGIRSSPEFWKEQKKNSMAMIRQLGIPSVFVTVSAAETKWYELLVILKKVVDDDIITEEQAETLTYNEKARLLQSDPITTARYFDHRFRELKKTWNDENGPFNQYTVEDYFFRVEFQHRGSPHVHMLLWLKNAPIYENRLFELPSEANRYNRNTCDFVDSIYTCSKVWDGSAHHDVLSKSDEETWKLLLKRQTHHHTSSCRRKRGGDKIVCRFNMPFMPMLETTIMTPLDCTDLSEFQIKRYKDLNKNIRVYLDQNHKTLSDSDMSFETFLEQVGISSYKDYTRALRINLKLNKVYLKRQPNEVMINNYNTKIISMFRSNMDIQYVLDPYACVAYILDYVNKADKGLSKSMEEIYVKHKDDPESSSFDMLKSLASTFYNSSEISAQEAAYNLLSIKMVESSCVTIFVPTSRPENRTHILKAQADLDKLDGNSTDCFVHGLVDHYVNRPNSLESITLAQFASYFEISLKDPRSRKKFNPENEFVELNEDTNNDDPTISNSSGQRQENNTADTTTTNSNFGNPGVVFKLKNDSGFLCRRKVSKIIRYYKFNIDDDRDEYFRVLLMLYYPWKNEAEDLLNIDTEAKFNENMESIMAAKREFCKIDDATLDGYMEQLQEEAQINQEEGENEEEAATGMNVNPDGKNDFARYTVDVDDSHEGDYHRNGDIAEELSNSTSRKDGSKTYLEKVSLPSRLSQLEFQTLVSKLNNKQREYLVHLTDHIRYNRERDKVRMFTNQNETVKTFKPFYHFVTGGAGVGKSMLIKALYESLQIEFGNDRDLEISASPVLLTAPTGKAAFNIKGQTLHSAFELPVSQYGKAKLNKLSDNVAHSMGVALKDLQVVIIDEISMVSTTTFSWIDMRLRYLFDDSLPFGGKSVIALGDFNQLPPVSASSLYSSKLNDDPYVKVFGVDLWKELFEVHKLEEIMRQRDDLTFAVALNNMAAGTMTSNDIRLFQSRVVPMTAEEMTTLTNNGVIFPHLRSNNNGASNQARPICLFHSNAEVRKMNAAVLQSMTTEGAISTSFDRVTGNGTGNQAAVQMILKKVSDDSAHQLDNMNLVRTLNLKIDARYMITINIDTADGLVNGTTGYLKKIDYGTLKNSSGAGINEIKPLRIWLKFDEESSGASLRKKQVNLRASNNIEDDSLTMIEPKSNNIHHNRMLNLTVYRKQFPIVPAEALTTHKSQGGTYQNVVVYDTGKNKMSRSLIYVACSRATSASGLTLICKNNKFIAPSPINSNSDLFKELQRHLTIKVNPTFVPLVQTSNFQIISHNVQSLNPHINQIINDPVYTTSKVILLNETWTIPTDDLTIPGFTLVSAVHCPNARKAMGSCCYVSDLLHVQQVFSKLFVHQDNNSSVSVSMVAINSTLFSSVYASPRTPTFLLLQAMDYIFQQDYFDFIIAGDFNVNFQEESNAKTALYRLFNQHGMKSTLPSSVGSSTKQGTLIDNIFSNIDIISSGRYISFTSYHEPLWLQIQNIL